MPIASIDIQTVIDTYHRNLKNKAVREQDDHDAEQREEDLEDKVDISNENKIEHIMNRFGNGAVRNYKNSALEFYRYFSE